MTKTEMFTVVRNAEIEAFNAWQEQEASSDHLDNYHTAFLVLHFLSNALRGRTVKRRE